MFNPQILVEGGAYSKKLRHLCIDIKDDEYMNTIKASAKQGMMF